MMISWAVGELEPSVASTQMSANEGSYWLCRDLTGTAVPMPYYTSSGRVALFTSR